MQIKKYIDQFFRDITTIGGIYIYILISLWFFAIGNTHLFLQLILGAIVTFIMAVIIRLVYFKERPLKQGYINLIEKIDASSFPSLHSARVGYMFLVIISQYNFILMVTLLEVIGLLVCYSRIYLRKHDLIDVIGGIIFGLAVGYMIINL